MLNRFVGLVMLCLLAAFNLAGCSNSEEQAHVEYQNIAALEKTGEMDQVLPLYAALAEKYPDTRAGKMALKAKERIVMLKQARQYRAMLKHAERVRMVFAGYQSMTGRFPVSVHDLDSGEYFFDSHYLAETVPDDGKIYILLAGKDDTRFWLLQQGLDHGYVAGMEGDMQTLPPAALEAEVAANYRVVETIGNLVMLEAIQR